MYTLQVIHLGPKRASSIYPIADRITYFLICTFQVKNYAMKSYRLAASNLGAIISSSKLPYFSADDIFWASSSHTRRWNCSKVCSSGWFGSAFLREGLDEFWVRNTLGKYHVSLNGLVHTISSKQDLGQLFGEAFHILRGTFEVLKVASLLYSL